MILYLDSSSAVKIYLLHAGVSETGAETVRGQVEGAELVATSRISYVEILSGLAKARRESRIRRQDQYQQVVLAFQRDWASYVKVAVNTRLIRAAGDLVQRYALRAYDAVQLAAALELQREIPTDFRFSSFDKDLNDAASAEGLAIT